MSDTEILESQNKRILKHLQQGEYLTPLGAFEMFGCFRLSARIKDLRNQGYEIERKMVESGKKKFACYFIKNPEAHATGLSNKTIL